MSIRRGQSVLLLKHHLVTCTVGEMSEVLLEMCSLEVVGKYMALPLRPVLMADVATQPGTLLSPPKVGSHSLVGTGLVDETYFQSYT